jgi:hypothetical protein
MLLTTRKGFFNPVPPVTLIRLDLHGPYTTVPAHRAINIPSYTRPFEEKNG